LIGEDEVLSFTKVKARAADRKGGKAILQSLLPAAVSRDVLAAVPDDRVLAEMTRRIFCSGFAWSVIDKKWPGFEEAFLGFDPARLLMQPPEFWDRLVSDARIVRNGQKIMAVAANARFVREVALRHGRFARFLAEWPSSDQVGLLGVLAKGGARLGGNTGMYFLRFIGWDGFMLSRDIVACLRDAGLDIADPPTSKRDLAKVQQQFNAWADETGLPYVHLSRICALSIGENLPTERLRSHLDDAGDEAP
jgi:3-methyladenine DNA glycosylase Tag